MFTINHFRLTALARRTPSIRSYSKKPQVIRPTPSQNQSAEQDDGDFRPPWVYSASHILTYTLIPTAILYCVFLADWGEREHVFSPVRRWTTKYKESFLSLSPDEASLIEESQPPSTTALPVTREIQAEGRPS
ncbi:uncharacterized protein HD556DRAFT_1414373 [Suillus plorans]|uniref:Uncharacterized protein n=1 Tax=Suillus plorans TaxID=116603 RepID=A0A9P7AE76_9AGAM|nr:uncharacterized protein HD556DRAFT_1414373 [Suillus plorans]KAG1786615.1 hypothetical protein HD556DRAFT_1414373 [Suillus plorans]